ncbi:hypothetical protein QTO34_012970 [Cnephaeus nilssonii]|uniref:Uncharacterized protein n=1 Tax=Cnephaeus nilssonii TaxID=3371016 RepID=A0AA40HAC1_CNENI|nr:hypothetical protein QTO34_012970 [Eptesicus nilssonii]
MVCVRFPGGSWMAALMVMLMALSPPLALARDTPGPPYSFPSYVITIPEIPKFTQTLSLEQIHGQDKM